MSLVALLVALAWGLVENKFMYRLAGFPPARSPSLLLELKQYFGHANFYGQFGQDKWIMGSVFPGVKDGYFVDIGAGDGIRYSNSKALEDLGWKGVAVEPLPTGWETRKCLLFKEVLSNKKGEVVKFRVADGWSGIDSDLGLLKEKVKDAPLVEFVTTTVADILEKAKAPPFIHYVSLDTEGAEYLILQAFPFSKYKVGALTIEHNFEEPKRTNIRKLLESNGYRFVKQQIVDDWYVSR